MCRSRIKGFVVVFTIPYSPFTIPLIVVTYYCSSEDKAMQEQQIGYVSNYYKNLSVAAVEITNGSVAVGDTLHFRGHTTDCELPIDSIQIEHTSVTQAGKGDSIGVKVPDRVRRHDKVYKVVGD